MRRLKHPTNVMRSGVPGTFVRTCAVAMGLFATPLLVAQQSADVPPVSTVANLGLDQVLVRLQERNAQRAAALQEFEGTRVYRMQYRGFPSDRDAEMVVNVKFHAPNSKDFSVVSETGSKFVIDHIFKRLLEEEKEASRDDNNRHDTALTRENYDFQLAGFESDSAGGR